MRTKEFIVSADDRVSVLAKVKRTIGAYAVRTLASEIGAAS